MKLTRQNELKQKMIKLIHSGVINLFYKTSLENNSK